MWSRDISVYFGRRNMAENQNLNTVDEDVSAELEADNTQTGNQKNAVWNALCKVEDEPHILEKVKIAELCFISFKKVDDNPEQPSTVLEKAKVDIVPSCFGKYKKHGMVEQLPSREVTPQGDDVQVTPQGEDVQVTPQGADVEVTPNSEKVEGDGDVRLVVFLKTESGVVQTKMIQLSLPKK